MNIVVTVKKKPRPRGGTKVKKKQTKKKADPRDKKPAPKGPPPKPRTNPVQSAPPSAPTPKPAPSPMRDARHMPWSEVEEEHRVYETFHAGAPEVSLSAKINVTAMADTAKAVKRITENKDLDKREKRRRYDLEIKRLVHPRVRFPKGTYYTKDTPKQFTALVTLVKKRIPFREPNKHLDDFTP